MHNCYKTEITDFDKKKTHKKTELYCFISVVQLAITVLWVQMQKSDVRTVPTRTKLLRASVKHVHQGTSVTTLSLLLSLTTQQQFAPWDTIVLKERGTTTNILVQLEPSIIEQVSTVKPVHVVTSIKQFPVLKGHLFLVLSYESFKRSSVL